MDGRKPPEPSLMRRESGPASRDPHSGRNRHAP